ncbi:MAG: hypothetical protein AB7K09_24900 [Planctomycetota bacterium]
MNFSKLPRVLGTAVVAVALSAGCSAPRNAAPAAATSGESSAPAAGDYTSARLDQAGQAGKSGADLDAATRAVSGDEVTHQVRGTAGEATPRPAQPAPAGNEAASNRDRLQIAEQERREAFNHFMRTGRDRLSQGRFEEAVRAYEEAVRLMPQDGLAQQALNDARQLIGRDGSRAAREFKSAQDEAIGQITEGLAQIRMLYNEGRKLFDDRNYKDSIRTLNQALEIARWLRGRVDTSAQERYIRGLIDQAQKLAAHQQQEDIRYTVLISEQIREVERQNRVRRWKEEVRTLYDAAKDQFDREEYDECLITLSKLVWKDPYNDDVLRLREYARNLKYQKRNRELKRKMANMWHTTRLELEEASTPFTGIGYESELTSIERWREIEVRAQKVLARQTTPEDPEVVRIKDVMNQKDVTLRFDGVPLPAVVRYLSERSGVNIILSTEVQDMGDDELEVQIDVGNIKLGAALRLLMDLLGLQYYIENGAVVISTEDEANGKGTVVRIFNVKDLLGGFRMFPGEEIRLQGDQPGFQGDIVQDDDEPIEILLDDLPDIIQQAVAPDKWDGDTRLINVGPNGTLIARNTPEVLNQVSDLLDDLRQSRGLMVTLEVRVITVRDNFLEEIGIDYRGAGGVPPGAVGPNLTTAPLDEFQFGLNLAQVNSNVLNIGRDNSAGFYFSNAPESEVRARLEHLFDQALGDPDVMTRAGGASFQLAFLDRVQINAVLRAVKKRERAVLVTAPKVTCFNTQRANITVRNQVAYIEDFNVQAQQNVTIADPVVGTIEDGLVLDVRPVISADRRYVTVELQPTIALLKRPLDTLTTTLGGPGSTPVTIQLPELLVQRIRTTVTVPDGGAFLLGGVRSVNDARQEVGVPLLSELPILGNLFKRQGKSELREDLVIMVKARITDLHEMVDLNDPGAGGSDGAAGSYAPMR